MNEIIPFRLKPPVNNGIIRLALLILASLNAAQALAVTPYKAEYRALIKLIPVEVEVTLRDAGDGVYTLKSDIHTRSWASLFSGSVVETSRFRIGETGVEPLEYEKRDGISDDEKNISTRFESDGSVISRFGGKDKRIEHEGQIVDLLTLRYLLAYDLSREQLAERYFIVDGKGRLKEIEVLDFGLETVDTGMGPMQARRLQYAAVDDPVYTVWAAPELDYQLVRIEQHKDGNLRAKLTLESYRPIIKKQKPAAK